MQSFTGDDTNGCIRFALRLPHSVGADVAAMVTMYPGPTWVDWYALIWSGCRVWTELRGHCPAQTASVEEAVRMQIIAQLDGCPPLAARPSTP